MDNDVKKPVSRSAVWPLLFALLTAIFTASMIFIADFQFLKGARSEDDVELRSESNATTNENEVVKRRRRVREVRPSECDEKATLNITGPIADLVPSVRASISNVNSRYSSHFERLDEFPLQGCPDDFNLTYIDFRNSHRDRVFSVAMNPTVKAGDTVKVVLGKPTFETELKKSFHELIGIWHAAYLGERIQYASLPKWNATTKTISHAGNPTFVVRRDGKNGPVLYRDKVANGGICQGFYWAAGSDSMQGLPVGTKLFVEVTHDTGDLFGKLTDSKTLVITEELEPPFPDDEDVE